MAYMYNHCTTRCSNIRTKYFPPFLPPSLPELPYSSDSLTHLVLFLDLVHLFQSQDRHQRGLVRDDGATVAALGQHSQLPCRKERSGDGSDNWIGPRISEYIYLSDLNNWVAYRRSSRAGRLEARGPPAASSSCCRTSSWAAQPSVGLASAVPSGHSVISKGVDCVVLCVWCCVCSTVQSPLTWRAFSPAPHSNCPSRISVTPPNRYLDSRLNAETSFRFHCSADKYRCSTVNERKEEVTNKHDQQCGERKHFLG